MSILLEAQKRQQQDPNYLAENLYAESASGESSNRLVLLLLVAILVAMIFGAFLLLFNQPESLPTVTQVKPEQPRIESQTQTVINHVRQPVLLGDINLTTTTKDKAQVKPEATPPVNAPQQNRAQVEAEIDTDVVQPVAQQANDTQTIAPIKTEQLQEMDIDPSLLAKFNAAIEQTMAGSADSTANTVSPALFKVKPLVDFPDAFQARIPALDFQTHIYSSEPEQRWVKVNGKIIREQQQIVTGVVLEEISQQRVIIKAHGERFSLPALTSWQY
ncbi:general secretion pathway protein A [Catenovulum agarivorans DS-2]|uniref:General secretion pathway protein A n=1 Tax=Catenovulum agarivorans DS-2 TaxID=1328313 RepID=W7QNZ9_9ALTE|nr:general secretion pathway protein GspB [Catenovulum agarivorans]EWH09628.1 general secretion pathway protein A [Catenovulum agarivorans DS-2]